MRKFKIQNSKFKICLKEGVFWCLEGKSKEGKKDLVLVELAGSFWWLERADFWSLSGRFLGVVKEELPCGKE